MIEQTFFQCNNCKMEMNESSFYYRLKSCDACTAKSRAFRVTVQEFFIKKNHGNSKFKNEGIHRNDELRYEYYRMEINAHYVNE